MTDFHDENWTEPIDCVMDIFKIKIKRHNVCVYVYVWLWISMGGWMIKVSVILCFVFLLDFYIIVEFLSAGFILR